MARVGDAGVDPRIGAIVMARFGRLPSSIVAAAVVVAVGAPFDFLGDVMHAGGMEMFDGYH